MLSAALLVAQGGSGGADPWLVVGVALIAATAALLGAVIAARTAGARQKEQLANDERRQASALAAESERLDKQLLAERERQLQQLQHDREAAELTELRRVLDAATDAFTTATTRALDAQWAWMQLRADPAVDQVKRVRELSDEASDAITAANMAWYRVTLRLGRAHPVVTTLGGAIESLTAIFMSIDPSARPSDSQRLSAEGLERDRNDQLNEFREAAVQAVGSRL